MAYDARLTSDVLNAFIRALFGELRRRARESRSLRSSQCGAVTFVQRYGDTLDPLSQDDPGMAALLANSVRRRIAAGSNTGRGIVRLGDQIDGDSLDAFESPRCAMVSGFSVHANVCIEARDRMRLERLCRYAGRP